MALIAGPMARSVLGNLGKAVIDNLSPPRAGGVGANPAVVSRVDDPARLAALESTCLLDTPEEEAFHRFTKIASKLLRCPVSLVSLVGRDRQYFKSAVGLVEPYATKRETPLTHSFCQYVVNAGVPLAIVDAREHPLVQDNGAVIDLGVIAYLGMPLTTPEGHTLGSFCAIDTKPREWQDDSIEILQDLAAMVMTEIELRTTARALREAHQQLEHAEEQRDELVHMLVHDLRNPLSSMLTALDVAQATGLTPKQREIVGIAYRSGSKLIAMLGDILEVSKAEAGEMKLHRTAVAVGELLETARDQVSYTAELAKVRLTVSVAENLPELFADGEKLRRVLVNLLANALQHSRREQVVSAKVALAETGSAIVVTVQDEGMGIPAELQPRLFEKYQAVQAPRLGVPSCGLGLAFCKKVIDAHGGEITLTSEVGQGTTFRLWLPLGLAEGLAAK